MNELVHPEPTSVYAVAALFGSLFIWVAALLAASPGQEDWIDRTEWLSRSTLA